MDERSLLIEAALREERLERRRNRRRLRNQLNIYKISDVEFVGNYRLSRELFEELCQESVPLLPLKMRRHGIEPSVKILTALNFYARGSYQGAVGQNMDGPMAQQTVSRFLQEAHPTVHKCTQCTPYNKETIIIACCVLHNLCIRAGIAVPELTEVQLEAERGRQVLAPAEPATTASQALDAGRRARARLMEMWERNM